LLGFFSSFDGPEGFCVSVYTIISSFLVGFSSRLVRR